LVWRSTSAINLLGLAQMKKEIDSLVAWLIPTIGLPGLLTYLLLKIHVKVANS